LSVYATDKIYKLQEAKHLKSNLKLSNTKEFAENMQQQFSELAKNLDAEKNNVRLLSCQRKMLEKSSKEFAAIAKNLDAETMDAVNLLQTLDRKLPTSLLKSIDPNEAKKIMALGPEVLESLRTAKTLKEAEGILELNNISKINKDVIKVFQSAQNADEVFAMAKVLTKSK